MLTFVGKGTTRMCDEVNQTGKHLQSHIETCWFLKTRYQGAATCVQQWDSCPDGAPPQSIILKGQSKELAIQSEWQRAFIHVEEYPQDALLLEWLAVLATLSIASMPQLPKSVEAKAEIIVTESVRNAKLLLSGHPNFKFMLSARVSNNLPVVLTVHERPIRDHCPEEVVSLVEERVAIVTGEGDFFGWVVGVPAELMDVRTKMMVHHFHAEACWLLLSFLIELLQLFLFVLFAKEMVIEGTTSLALVTSRIFKDTEVDSRISAFILEKVCFILYAISIARY